MISTRTMQMTLLSTRTMPNDVGKHKNNANESVSTRTMAEDGDKHKNNTNKVAKHKNYAK